MQFELNFKKCNFKNDSESFETVQTFIKLTDLIAIRSCTCRKTPTKLVCKCIQAKIDQEQNEFINPTLTKNVINGNFEQTISFVHANGAFDTNEQFQLRRVDSTLSSESNEDLDEQFNEEEINIEQTIDETNDIDENDNCIEVEKYSNCTDEIDDVCMNEEDEGVETPDERIDDKDLKENSSEIKKSSKEFKKPTNQDQVTKLEIKESNDRSTHKLNRFDQNEKEIRLPILKNSNKVNPSLESDELNCSLDEDELIDNQENLNNLNSLDKFENQQMTNKRRFSILKDYAQSNLMTSTSSGISTSSCNSTLNKSKDSSQPNTKILIRCVRIYYSVPYSSFNFKIKCINLIPEYVQDNMIICPETLYNEDSNKFASNKYFKVNDENGSTKLGNQFELLTDSMNTLNSLQMEPDQQRINMINLMNATSQNRILEQKRIKQFVTFIKDHLQEFNRPKSLLLFINPVGGKKRAPIIYKKICRPLLSIASVKVHAIFTQKANHAYQLLRSENVDLSQYQALGCVGGDGMYSELLNGMLKRSRNISHSSSPEPINMDSNDETSMNKGTSRRNSSSSIAKGNGKQKKSKQSESEYSNDEQKNEEQSNKTNPSYNQNTKKVLKRNAIQQLIQLTSNNPYKVDQRRSKLGARYSLPNDKSANLIDNNDLNRLRYAKRYSLPVNSFRTKSIDLGNTNRNLPLLIVPGGSTDAVAYSTNGINDPQTVMCNFLLGKQINVDVAAVHTVDEDNRLLKYCSSFLGYGYFGDILRDSEQNLRWMGPKRYDWAGLKKFFLHKVYKGELLLKVSLLDGDPKDNNHCLSNCQLCSKSYIRNFFNMTVSNNDPKTSVVRNKEQNDGSIDQDDINNNMNIEDEDSQEDNLIIKNINNKNTINLNKTNKLTGEDENTSIICIKGRFLAINAATMSCRCGHSKYGISPSQHIGNGCCDLIVVSQCTRKDYLKYLIRTGFSEKSAFDLDFVNVYRVKEFTFTPIVETNQNHASVWNCDGEILNEAAINVKIHCQLVSVFGNGVELRPASKQFVKREKLQEAFKMKLKNSTKIEPTSLEETKVKRYKTSFKTTSNEERRMSKVEFKDLPPQTNLVYQPRTIET